MDFFTSIKNMPKRNKIIALAAGCIIIFLIMLLMMSSVTGKEHQETFEYDNIIERKLADAVKGYLGEYLILEEQAADIIANEAVLNYRIIMESGTQNITDEHTEVLNVKMSDVLNKNTSDGQINHDGIEALASGISRIILDIILEQIEQSKMAGLESYQEEYQILTDSLQAQIDELKEKSMSVNITARIKDNQSDIADVKNEIYSNVDSELSSMRQAIDNISDGADGKDGRDGIDGKDGTDGKNGINGKDGADGKNGINGKDGADGKNGIDGKNGTDGKTTYFAYADDSTGKGFSINPTATSKYIGTCVTTETQKPTRASAYSNWQLITGKDGKDGADGKTTYFAYADDSTGKGFSINPTATSKYIGTCVTTEATQPLKASEYSNWQLIAGEDGTNGKDGADGADGKTTFIAYADDQYGNGFSVTPTETSKYIGTCVTTETTQPLKASEYGNWQIYRSYIITSTTDENKNTTLYIK